MINRQVQIGNDGFAIERFAQGMQFNKGAREDVSVIYRLTLSRGLMQIEPQLEKTAGACGHARDSKEAQTSCANGNFSSAHDRR
ncbi:hypothetical protein QEP77_12435 [Serratia sp. B1]|nr:hypothetical protein QEP77_12435 [Serratia sp. B1]